MPKISNATTIKAMEDAKNGKTTKHKNVQELIAALSKGWDGPVSKRKVKDIINDKLKARNS